MKSTPSGLQKCQESDTYSFRQCNANQHLIIYHCHAGLIEATAPLIDNHIVIRYLMFGQISDAKSMKELKKLLSDVPTVDEATPSEDIFSEIPLKTDEQIRA
ncbi:MAG: PocR ligand-binding domain-containing protein, partial [Lachnospiraceae bacterium]|nr:PocR ligand-binding domain-containing protein [Lachnospiraceae bacterium]